jgi:hypothetical protein
MLMRRDQVETQISLVINQVVTAVYSSKLLRHTDDIPGNLCNKSSGTACSL